MLIILGTFLRGPNWNFFGPFEYLGRAQGAGAEQRRPVAILLDQWLSTACPRRRPAAAAGRELRYILLARMRRASLLVLGYFVLLPPLMATTIFRKFFVKMGFIRFMLMANLLLLMAALPIKMVLRWSVNLKYIISIPEYFLNF